MHQASVGFQCPECTKSGAQKFVRARSLGGGGMLVTNLLIAVNVAVYVAGIGSGGTTRDSVVEHFGLIKGPVIDSAGQVVGVAQGEWYRVVTSGFLHANAIHIGLNMLVLYQLGRLMEPVLGRLRFSLCYAVALLAGSFGVLMFQPNSLTVGASGAIFGIMGAAASVMRSRGINVMQSGVGGTILLNVLFTFAIPGISIGAHLGGLAGGFVAGWILTDLGPRRWRNPAVPTAIVAALGVVLVGACLAV
jgi:membrane associated rhomboid family serine protease